MKGKEFEIESNLKKLMGESRPSYGRQLKERLERRKFKMLQGLDKEEESETEIEEKLSENKSSAKDVLLDLDNRLKEEKKALLARYDIFKLRKEYRRSITTSKRIIYRNNLGF